MGKDKKEKEGHAKVKKKHDQAKELKEALQRLQAEFENSRKRMEKEKQDFSRLANAGIVKELLPVLDSGEAAEKHLEEHEEISKEDA
ncbi:MAG: nucleotide exchange factor GrpE, partial [Candidatus Diapherotrites archaeon]|nr:nucleotide exchange factor GrpE [Candidatus Diapherotrites archaeon]